MACSLRIALLPLLILFIAPAHAQPVAPVREFVQIWHGKKFYDPYYWLREKGSAAVEKYLADENQYTQEQTKNLQPFEGALYKEMLGRIKQNDTSAATRDRRYYYYSKTLEGSQYPIYCRKRTAKDGTFREASPEEIILDQNALGKDLAFISVGARKISDDEFLLLYTTDTIGYRQYNLYLKNLKTGEVTGPLAQRVTSVTWAADNATLFYVTEDPITKRSDTLWRLKIGGTPEKVFFEKNESFNIGVGRTKDKRFIMLMSKSTDTWDTWLLKSDAPASKLRIVLPHKTGHKYDVEHRDGWLYIRTNKEAKNFRLVKAPIKNPTFKNWRTILKQQNNALLSAVEVFSDFIAVQQKIAGLNQIRIYTFSDGVWKTITLPEPVYFASMGSTPMFDSQRLRLSYQSFVTPPSAYDVNMKSGVMTLVKQEEVLGGYDPKQYATERLWAKARDGTKIPISIVYKKGLVRDGHSPLWLYGYGSYGYGLSATFNSQRISLLERGVAFAMAHVRGGNEMGEAWHDAGMLMEKKNTFFDFIDSAEYLIKEKWTSKKKILAEGGSAGGLLMGAVLNLRPDLFGAVHAAVPFVDVMNTMMDASLPLTVGEYLEWGNPNQRKAFEYMLSYSPYDNLTKRSYPPILVTTSYNDSQVMYWEPAKYVAKLRTLKTDQNALLLKTKMSPAGHGGASGRYDVLHDIAFEYAWMLSQVGINK